MRLSRANIPLASVDRSQSQSVIGCYWHCSEEFSTAVSAWLYQPLVFLPFSTAKAAPTVQVGLDEAAIAAIANEALAAAAQGGFAGLSGPTSAVLRKTVAEIRGIAAGAIG